MLQSYSTSYNSHASATSLPFCVSIAIIKSMKDMQQIRLNNLNALVRLYGNQTRLGGVSGVSGNYISQMLRGHRNMGEKVARKMEVSIGLPSGWFDTDEADATHATIPLSEEEDRRLDEFMERRRGVHERYGPDSMAVKDPAREMRAVVVPDLESARDDYFVLASVDQDAADKKINLINEIIKSSLSDEQLFYVQKLVEKMASETEQR